MPLSTERAFRPLINLLASLALALSACGGDATTTCECTPTCAPKFHCACDPPMGCVPDSPIDIALPTTDLSVPSLDGGGCLPACSGATPYCNSGHCVACLADAHCPLGTVCKTVGDSAACVPGCSDDSRCASPDGGASVRCCAGACVDTARDPSHCGGCNSACSAMHAAATCSAGACAAGACNAGWGDCNRDPKDGCETNILVDTANCGSCGVTCRIAHATAACSGACYLAACTYGWDDCNDDLKDGCETAVQSDPKNCGACGTVCAAVPHATIGCSKGSCQVTQCDANYAECDGDPKTGCESDLRTDAKNCGGCGAACANGLVCKNGGCTCAQCNFPNAKSDCVMNVCKLTACLTGYGDCDVNPMNGCEIDLTSDAANCGACGLACGGKTPYCSSGKCTANPCTGKAGGVISMAMGMPMYGFCWYLGAGGATCDDVCAASGGSNQAVAALEAFADDCSGGAGGQPAKWFYDNGNACGWTMPNGAPTGYLTLGHGYNNMDNAGRSTVYMGKCNMGGMRNVGVMPGDTNDSTGTGNSRCVVCACSH